MTSPENPDASPGNPDTGHPDVVHQSRSWLPYGVYDATIKKEGKGGGKGEKKRRTARKLPLPHLI